MSLSRVIYYGFKTFSKDHKALFKNNIRTGIHLTNFIRNFRPAYASFLRIMKTRREIAGPAKERKRSEWMDWNYNAELYAFNKRLNENISEDTLKTVFVHDSYIKIEEEHRKEMEIQDAQLNLKSNSMLVSLGEKIMFNFLNCYLRQCFEYMPEDGIVSVRNYLMSNEMLAYISSNLGTKDLIISAEYPPENQTLASTLKAVIGGLASSDSTVRAENFVLDFICPQLIGKDILEIWDIKNPLLVLNGILKKQGLEQFESRLIFESGRNTIESVYQVGLYSNKTFLGKGFGETLTVAEEMAAYDSLRRIFGLNESKKCMPFGEAARKIEFQSVKEHVTIDEFCKIEDSKNIVSS